MVNSMIWFSNTFFTTELNSACLWYIIFCQKNRRQFHSNNTGRQSSCLRACWERGLPLSQARLCICDTDFLHEGMLASKWTSTVLGWKSWASELTRTTLPLPWSVTFHLSVFTHGGRLVRVIQRVKWYSTLPESVGHSVHNDYNFTPPWHAIIRKFNEYWKILKPGEDFGSQEMLNEFWYLIMWCLSFTQNLL